MAVNPAIAMGVRGIELADPLAQYGRVAAIQQAQQQNALAQLQMRQAEREQEATNALNAAYRDAYNPQTGDVDINKLRSSLATGNYGSKLPDIEKKIADLKTQRLTQQKTEGEIAGQALTRTKTEGEVLDAALKRSRGFLENLDPNAPGAAEAYLAWHEANHRDPIIGKALEARGITAEQSRGRIMQLLNTPGGLARLINESKLGTEKFMELNKPQLSTTDIGGQVLSRTFQPLTSQLTTIGTDAKTMAPGEAERLKNDATRIRQEGQRIGLEGRRVAVLEENNRRDADPAFQQRMGAARATGEAIAKGDVAAVQALPKIVSRAEEGVRLIDELIGIRDSKTGQLLTKDPVTGEPLKNNKPHPGFQNAVGATWLPGARLVPGTDAAGFMSRFDQIKGASFLEAFESLKGGGAITEKEGQKGTDAINRMSTSTDEKEFIRAAMDLQDIIRKGVQNAQTRAARAEGPATVPGRTNAPAVVPGRNQPASATGGVRFLGFE
jgi:hypothetical protein